MVALVPKDSTEEDQRPITVATLVYRTWACVRGRQLCEWVETWAAPTQFGYRRGKRSVDPAWNLPVHSGLPVSFCDTWINAIRGARKFLKTAHRLGRILMSVWSRALSSETSVSVRSYACSGFQGAAPWICITQEYIALTGQRLNVVKSFGWATTRSGREHFKGLQLQGQPLPLKAASKDLGCQVVFDGPRRTQVHCERFSKARKAAKRARCAPLPLLQKAPAWQITVWRRVLLVIGPCKSSSKPSSVPSWALSGAFVLLMLSC